MSKFIFWVKEVWVQPFEVEAATEEEAKAILLNNKQDCKPLTEHKYHPQFVADYEEDKTLYKEWP